MNYSNLLIASLLCVSNFVGAQKANDGDIDPCKILTIEEIRTTFHFSGTPKGMRLPEPFDGVCEYEDKGVATFGGRALITIYPQDRKVTLSEMQTIFPGLPGEAIVVPAPMGDEAYFLISKTRSRGSVGPDQVLHGRVGERHFRVFGMLPFDEAGLKAAISNPNLPSDEEYTARQREAIMKAARMVATRLAAKKN